MSKEQDFEERLILFAQEIIKLCKSINQTAIVKPLIDQLIRAGTSIGANYCEANNASSRNDFRAKIFICKKEAQETKYWLRLIKPFEPVGSDRASKLLNECHEFSLIFQKIISTMSVNGK